MKLGITPFFGDVISVRSAGTCVVKCLLSAPYFLADFPKRFTWGSSFNRATYMVVFKYIPDFKGKTLDFMDLAHLHPS